MMFLVGLRKGKMENMMREMRRAAREIIKPTTWFKSVIDCKESYKECSSPSLLCIRLFTISNPEIQKSIKE